ncbi:MAG TPA: hypothetical protein VF174_13115 [Micromonosporaceae bacterium]
MTDQHAELDAALERVIEAARAHLAAVKTAGGHLEDDRVWQAYVALNNASSEYDDLLLETYGEVTPWDVERIDPDQGRESLRVDDGTGAADPYPRVVSVRQRRDYRVPSVSALLRVAQAARAGSPEAEEAEPIEGVGEAVLELLQSGDGSLGVLDIPELEPLDGVVVVAEVSTPLDVEAYDDEDVAGPFEAATDDRVLGRLDERLVSEADIDQSAG